MTGPTAPFTTADAAGRVLIPAGYLPVYEYVPLDRIRVASPGQLHLPTIEEKHKAVVNSGGAQLHVAPFGDWEGDTFVVRDGRHALEALRIAGFSQHILVWRLIPHRE